MSEEVPVRGEVRLSVVQGDRLCIRCGFNLSGQVVVRDAVYQMPIVRCPECSTVASLQEYPLLGKWVGRLGAAIAAAWLFMLIGGIAATGGTLCGLSLGVRQSGSMKLAMHVVEMHNAWLEKADEKDKKRFAQNFGQPMAQQSSPYSWLDQTWWDAQNPRAIVNDMGGVARAIDWALVGTLMWAAFTAWMIGMVWSVFLLGLQRKRLLVFALLPVGLACLFALMFGDSSEMRWMAGGPSYLAMEVAERILNWWLLSLSLAVSLIALWGGMMVGRSVTRWLVKLMLPPRAASSLALLWIADGKRPPGVNKA